MKFSQVQKVGLLLVLFGYLLMLLLALTSNIIPDLVMWIFTIGVVTVIISNFFVISKQKKLRK